MSFLFIALETMSAVLIFVLGVLVLVVIIVFILDVTQTEHAIRRNYPVIGHFRYLFEHLGEFFRQYFFAMDREELPFNRAQRSWAYRAAKDLDSTIAFGSTRDLRPPGTILFVNCPFPKLDKATAHAEPMTIGPDCEHPFVAKSFFNISAMSYGAISRPAVRALSNGAQKAGCWLNTGEGGIAPYHLEGGCDVVFQVGTAKNGVSNLDGKLDDQLVRKAMANDKVRMIELKLSQGAKPGKGGILPGAKVTAEIAGIRNIRIGEDAISPNRHPDIDNVDELLDMINRLRDVSGKPVGFKAVIGAYGWLDELGEAIVRRGVDCAPDFMTVDSADGGTGAAPMPLMDSVGLPISESLPLLVDSLMVHGLRERIRVVASGKLMIPTNVAWALCAGADFAASARGFMFALGCIQALQCNKNTCPTGITTHDERLQRGLVPEDKAERVHHYHDNMLREVGIIAHSCGVTSPRDLKRYHARIMTDRGRSIALNELFPYPS